MTVGRPSYSATVVALDVPALTDQREDPTEAVQYAVLDRGVHHAYGDQHWVAWGMALTDAHPHGRVQRRTVTITYGEWEDVAPVAYGSGAAAYGIPHTEDPTALPEHLR